MSGTLPREDLPDTTSKAFERLEKQGAAPAAIERLERMILGFFRTAKAEDLKKFYAMTEGSENRIIAAARTATSIEDLYGKVNLNLEFDPEEVYQLKNSQTANADQTNQIVKARIEDLARYIRKSMAGCPNTVNTKMPVFLTGGGLSNVKGGVEYLSTVLDKPVSVAHSVNPLTDKPQYASAFGVIDLVLNQNN